MLRELGLAPTVFHLNEGHSAFLQLERWRELAAAGLAPDEALERLRSSTVFTTHTPVPAGNEVFDPELVHANVAGLVASCGLEWDDFLALGKVSPDETRFGLTPFALRTSRVRERRLGAARRGVARDVARASGRSATVDEVPITSITNGVHQRTWVSPELEELLGDTDPQFERARDVAGERCGRRTSARSGGCFDFIAETRGARELDPEVAHDRLRAALRDVQAREPPLLAGPSGSPRCSATPTGRSRCSSPARRIRPTRAART